MREPRVRPPVAYIHAGTHKTGTTSIQVLLASNEAAFREAGIFIPRTGRLDSLSAGQHNIAWEIYRDKRFVQGHGTMAELFDEIRCAAQPVVCLTSEEFEFVATNPPAFASLVDGLRSAGYDVRVILYLRPQADYLESLYVELLKNGWDVEFGDVLESSLTDGLFESASFDYRTLIASFSNIVGRDRLILRSYRWQAPNDRLLEEFIDTISTARGAVDFASLIKPGRLNTMLPFGDVIAVRGRHAARRTGAQLSSAFASHANECFDPLTLRDILRMIARFAVSNVQIRQAHGITIGCVTRNMLMREIRAGLLRDRASRRRKHLIRKLDVSPE